MVKYPHPGLVSSCRRQLATLSAIVMDGAGGPQPTRSVGFANPIKQKPQLRVLLGQGCKTFFQDSLSPYPRTQNQKHEI